MSRDRPAPPVVAYGPRTNRLAVGALVAGIASWTVCPLIAALVAVFLGTGARRQISGTDDRGGGMAMAGLILGYIQLVAVGLVLLVWLGSAILLGSCPQEANVPCR